ncbi:hypothetical protein ACFQPF_08435 [Fictibacillus iocasae]|uniref:Uncharacterized protein n=1 Tax=Fictibacillus iocasae TaxID=2715437 RepID=A0ABW2NM45_9BACL
MRGHVMSAGAVSIITGISFAARMYGPQEDGLQGWGYAAIFWGSVLLYTALQSFNMLLLKLVSGFGVFLHGPPFILWILFHGSTLTDRPSGFQAHWAFSLPYLYIIGVCLYVIAARVKTFEKYNNS